MRILLQDLRVASRALLKSPSFTLVALLAIALGIGINTVVFSVVDATLLHPLPFPEPQRLVSIRSKFTGSSITYGGISNPDINEIRSRARTLASAAFYKLGAGMTLTETSSGIAGRVNNVYVSANLFEVLGTAPALGREFHEEDSETGNEHVVVVSHSFWRTYLGASRDAAGTTIRLDDQPHKVIGVMPESFDFPSPFTDVWIPAPLSRNPVQSRLVLDNSIVARLKSGILVSNTNSELSAIGEQLGREFADDEGIELRADSLQDLTVGPVRQVLLMLLGAVGLVLLIACANVASLLLVRLARREREFAIRTALGASQFQMIRTFLSEGLLLALWGGVLGLSLAYYGIHLVRGLAPANIPGLRSARIDGSVLAFTAGISLFIALFFSLIPVFRQSSADLNHTLREGGQASQKGFRLSRSTRLQSASVITQIALASILLVGAGLLLRSLAHLLDVRLGFEPRNLLALRLSQRRLAVQKLVLDYDEILAQVRAIPGVRSAALAETLPLGSAKIAVAVEVAGKRREAQRQRPDVQFQEVSPDYFETMGIRLLEGRDFTDRDAAGAPCAVVINEPLSSRLFADQDALGKLVNVGGGGEACEVVGVAGAARDVRLESQPEPEIYVPYRRDQEPVSGLVVRTFANPLRVSEAVVKRVWSVDPDERVLGVMTMDDMISRSLIGPRFRVATLGLFVGLALLLAAIGVYGVLGYSVTQRVREIGIRMALGASRAEILRLIIGQGVVLALVGLCFGFGCAYAFTRLLTSLLFGITATDPVTFLAVAFLLLAAVLLASYIPARRATKIDPAAALRCE